MTYNPEIFRAYDIRGIYGRDFDDDFAFRLGAGLVKYLNRKNFLVAYDNRVFSEELAESLIKGITSMGGDVNFIGRSTMPFFCFVFGKLGVNGGVIVTASHNAPEYGGFKIFGDGCEPIDSGSGLEVIRDLITSGNFTASKYGGRVLKPGRQELLEKYIEFVIKKSGAKPGELKSLKVAARGNELVREEINLLFSNLGIRNSENDLDVAFSFDGDADRLAVFDKGNKNISPDFILGLLAGERIGFLSKPKVAYDLRFSRGVLEKFKEWGIKSFRSRVGRTFIREKMVKHRANIGGELSGHILFKENNYFELPLMAMLEILKLMAKTGKGINQLVEEFKTWSNSGEINIAFSAERLAFREILKRIKEEYKNGRIDELDGVTVEYNDWWFNLRPSNTEPVLRLVVEAKTENLLNEKAIEVKTVMGS